MLLEVLVRTLVRGAGVAYGWTLLRTSLESKLSLTTVFTALVSVVLLIGLLGSPFFPSPFVSHQNKD